MKHALSPSLSKLWPPLALLLLGVMPDMLGLGMMVRELIFRPLAWPFVLVTGHLPFPYRDKPWNVSPFGALATAAVWAVLFYLFLSWREYRARMRTEKRETI